MSARLALDVALLVALRAGNLLAGADEPAVMLPPLMVEEKGRVLPWRYVELPGLEVISVCDDSTTKKYVERQVRLEEMLRVVLPEKFRARFAVSEAHVLFNEETGRARSREVIADMVQQAGASIAADGTIVAPTGAAEAAWQSGFGSRPSRIQFLPNFRLTDMDAVSVFSIVDETGDATMDFTFAADRVAFLLAHRAPALPDWLVEGLNAVYGHTRFRDNEIEFLPLVWLSAEESTALARDPDRPRLLLPMQELFAGARRGDGAEAQTMEPVWRAQCALFVRWALSEKSGARREALWRWVERLDTELPTEKLFRECFGMGFAAARDRLSDHLPVAVNRSVTLELPMPGPLPRIKMRAATDLEVARIRGDWERLEIGFVRKRFPALTASYVEQARKTLHRVYDRGERDPRLLAVLGLTECDAENPVGAREFLEGAVSGKVVRPRAYFELARLRYKEIADAAGERKLDAKETASVLAPLRVARFDAPPLPEAYALMTGVWLRSSAPPTREDLAALDEGVRLFPGVPTVVMAAIQIHVANGSIAPAASFAAVGLRSTRDPAVRERFERVQTELAAVKK